MILMDTNIVAFLEGLPSIDKKKNWDFKNPIISLERWKLWIITLENHTLILSRMPLLKVFWKSSF